MQKVAPALESAALVGDASGRERLATPALLVDLECLEGNLSAVVERCRRTNVSLRPHVKGHKCVELARRQLESGAIGLSCTTLAEAELMVEAGAESLLITSPVGSFRAGRLAGLVKRVREVVAVCDDRAGLEALSKAADAAGRPLQVLVDIDVGQRRTGVPAADHAGMLEVARAVESTAGLVFAGLQAYYGHLQSVPGYRDRSGRVREAQRLIADCVAALKRDGLEPRIVSGGGTGTLLVDTEDAPFTEIQPGSYPFLDVQYGNEELTPDGSAMLRQSLFVRGRVVSARQADRVTIDVGMKAVSTDGGPPVLARPGDVKATYAFAGDEHGFLMPEEGTRAPALGEAVELIPSHCDTTTNLHAAIHAVRGDVLEGLWPIGARGAW